MLNLTETLAYVRNSIEALFSPFKALSPLGGIIYPPTMRTFKCLIINELQALSSHLRCLQFLNVQI